MTDFNARIVLSAKNNAAAPMRQLRNDLRGLTQSLRGLGRTTGLRDLQRDFVGLGRTIGDVHRRHVKPMIGSLARIGGFTFGAGLTASAIGVTRTMDNARESLDAFSKASRKIDIPPDTLRAFAHVADLAGVDLSAVTTGLQGAAKALKETQNGVGRANSRLKEFAPQLRNQMAVAKSAAEAASLALSAMHQAIEAGDEPLAQLISETVFKSSDWFAIGEMSGSEVRQGIEDALKLIGPIDAKALLRVEEFNDELTNLRMSWIGTRDAIAADLLPELTPFIKEWTKTFTTGRAEFVKDVGETARAIGAMFQGFSLSEFNKELRLTASTLKSIIDTVGPVLRVLQDPAGFGQSIGRRAREAIIGPTGRQSGETREQALDSWLDGLPRRAQGGPLAAGQTAIVGEEGPELFRPDRAGVVLPSRTTRDLLRGQFSTGAASEEEQAGPEVLSALADLIETSNDIHAAVRAIRLARLGGGTGSEAMRAKAIRALRLAGGRGEDLGLEATRLRAEAARLRSLPRRAKGGPLAAGQVALVGEEGPELFRPSRAGIVVPAKETREALRAAGRPVRSEEERAGPETLDALAMIIEMARDVPSAVRAIRLARLGGGTASEAMRAKAIRALRLAGGRGEDLGLEATRLRAEAARLRSLPRRAKGGPLAAGQLALVGEEGPELFRAEGARDGAGARSVTGALVRAIMSPVRAVVAPFRPLTEAIGDLTRVMKLAVGGSMPGLGGPLGAGASLGGVGGLASVRETLRRGNISVPGKPRPGTKVQGGSMSGAAGEILTALRGSGFSDVQAYALLGHMQQESSLRPGAWNSREGAGGLLQWRGNRLENLKRFAASRGTDWQDRGTQAAFVRHEMDTDSYERERSARFRSATTLEGASAALRDYVRFGDNSAGTRLANARRFAQEAGATATASAASGAVNSGAMAPLTYANQGAIRNHKVTQTLERAIQDGVAKVFGNGYSAQIYSGGQNPLGVGGPRTGSTRHDDHGAGGMAADLYVIGPDGRRVRGDALAKLGQHWLATKQGGVGLEMRGGGIHLDEHRDRARLWNYADKGGSYTASQRAMMEAGLAGIPPEYAPRSSVAARSLRPNMNRKSFTPATREQGYRAADVPASKVEIGKGSMDIRLSLPDGVGVSAIGVKQPENLTANVGVDRTGSFRPANGTKTGMRGPN